MLKPPALSLVALKRNFEWIKYDRRTDKIVLLTHFYGSDMMILSPTLLLDCFTWPHF